ncbi:hypothetical protein AB1Y20_000753 [Prymnesium parvum]|uniref:Uncharacterized protein n=1 Tax=Prymnesium parvum TaxID=97485 RepID=A0AB34K671_PRYPA
MLALLVATSAAAGRAAGGAGGVLMRAPHAATRDPALAAQEADCHGGGVGGRRGRAAQTRMMAEGAEGAAYSPRDRLHNLLVQCSIQTQLGYYNEFKNELRGRWLESFLGHEHLKVQRTQGTGTGLPLYKGVEGALRCSWREYLRTMLGGQVQTYDVSYKVGTTDTAGSLANAASEPSRGEDEDATGEDASESGQVGGHLGTGAEAPWAAAAASRKANPYLKKQEQYRTFKEVIEPQRVARGIMSIRSQLAYEWSQDLMAISREGAFIKGMCDDAEAARSQEDEDVPLPQLLGDRVFSDPSSSLPDACTTSFRAATLGWSQQEDLEDLSRSPFRELHFDLLQRAVSREAALAALAVLSQNPESGATANWLREKLQVWLPRFEQPSRSFLGTVFVVELLSSSPVPTQAPDGKMGLADPAVVAAEVLSQRERIASKWSAWLSDAQSENDELLREALEQQLKGSDQFEK